MNFGLKARWLGAVSSKGVDAPSRALSRLRELAVPPVVAFAGKGGAGAMQTQTPGERPDPILRFSHKFGLSAAQQRVFAMLVHGIAPKQIAVLLRVSHTTVRRHAEDVYRKCGVRSQRETLALFARTIMGVE